VPVPVHSQYNNTRGSRVLVSNSQNHYHIMLYIWYMRSINLVLLGVTAAWVPGDVFHSAEALQIFLSRMF